MKYCSGPYSLRPEAWAIATVNIESERAVGKKGQPPELTREASQPWWGEFSTADVAETHRVDRLTRVQWMQRVEVGGLRRAVR